MLAEVEADRCRKRWKDADKVEVDRSINQKVGQT